MTPERHRPSNGLLECYSLAVTTPGVGHMRRREFLGVLGGAAAWPLAARAQQPALPVIGFLHQGSPEPYTHLMTAFRHGLNETGYVEHRNVAIEYRWAQNQKDRLPGLAPELARLSC